MASNLTSKVITIKAKKLLDRAIKLAGSVAKLANDIGLSRTSLYCWLRGYGMTLAHEKLLEYYISYCIKRRS